MIPVADRRRAAMRNLHVAHIKIIVGEYRASDRTDEDCAVLQTQVLQGVGNQLVGNAVSAAGTVVRLVLQARPCVRTLS